MQGAHATGGTIRVSVVIGVLATALLPACLWDYDCVNGTVRVDGACVRLDAGTDASLDAATDGARDAAEPDAPMCTRGPDCPPRTRATAECVDQSCRYSCEADFGDCDDMPSSGCETDLAVDTMHCGDCDTACQWSCASSSCNDAIRVTAAYERTCAVRADGTLVCWGMNMWGQLGDGTMDDAARPRPVAIAERVSDVVGGVRHTCALTDGGSVLCWGDNSVGQLGNGGTEASPTPVSVMALSTAVARISAGAFHSCLLFDKPGASVHCWGNNDAGQLGYDPSSSFSSLPGQVLGAFGAIDIATGDSHSCYVAGDGGGGRVFCWGHNGSGQLGDGTFMSRPNPRPIDGLTDVFEITAGRAHTCARQGGAVWCWGEDFSGQLGDGMAGEARATPERVLGLDDAAAIDAGDGHTCARRMDGQVVCWGGNGAGGLGDGTDLDRASFVIVMGLGPARQVSAGGGHTCAALEAGRLLCWGANASGQVGDGTMIGPRPLPVLVLPPLP